MVKRTLICLALSAFAVGTSAADSADPSLKSSTKAAVSSTVTAGKNLLGGLVEGVTEGRENAAGIDGAVIVSDEGKFAQYMDVEVLSAEQVGDRVQVMLGFKNRSEQPVRVINLASTGVMLLIDRDGYSSPSIFAEGQLDEVTIPPLTGVKHQFAFKGLLAESSQVRMWRKNLSLP